MLGNLNGGWPLPAIVYQNGLTDDVSPPNGRPPGCLAPTHTLLAIGRALASKRSLAATIALSLILSMWFVVAPPKADAAHSITCPTFKTADNGGGNATASDGLTIEKPVGVANGDVLVAQITFESGTGLATVTAPGGWSLEDREDRRGRHRPSDLLQTHPERSGRNGH